MNNEDCDSQKIKLVVSGISNAPNEHLINLLVGGESSTNISLKFISD